MSEPEILVIHLADLIPDEIDVMKFAILFKNRDALVKILSDEETEKKLEQYDALAASLDIDGDMLYNSLFIAKLFYLANVEISIAGEEQENDNS